MTEKVRDFFANNANPGWETFKTCSRCEGFTLSYGLFLRLDDDKINFDEMISKECIKSELNMEDQCRIMRQAFSNPDTNDINMICDILHYSYPELEVYALPCCWGRETNFDIFVGFNIYPLLWTKRRHIVENHKLISLRDDFSSTENKDAIIQKYKDQGYKLYKAPKFLKTDYIFDFYCDADSWKDTLYVENYDEIKHWIPMLNDLYNDVISSKTIELKKFINNNKIFNEQTVTTDFKWCFLPSDCASCS